MTYKSCGRIWTPWGEWKVEYGTKLNSGKCKAIRLKGVNVKISLGYSLDDQKFSGSAGICKHLGIILRSDLNWVD